MTVHTPAACTVWVSAAAQARCGHAAVWSNGEFAECARHAADPGSMASFKVADRFGVKVGDHVDVHRYGKVYDAVVVEVGARGAVYAEFTYGNGARRRVRVFADGRPA